MHPEKFGRYEVAAEIGDGAMGRVYRGFDPLVRRPVAIKTVKSEYLTRETRSDYLRRFRREAQAAGALSHPHIVSIYDVGEDYIVMEFLEGTSLQALLRERSRLTTDEALQVLGPVADALDYAHKSGVVHRDIKPANIMVLADGRPKLMDFGVAHLEASVMTQAGEIFGSPSYMAPEQISGLEVTARSDLFSLAVVAYECLTGHKPFDGSTVTTIIYKVMHAEPAPPRQWNFELPEHYDAIFARALAKEAEKRFPSAAALVRALELKEFDEGFDSVLVGLTEPAAENAPPAATAAPAARPDEETHAYADLPQAAPPDAAPARARRGWLPVAAGLAAAALALSLYALFGPGRKDSGPSPLAFATGALKIVTDPPGAAVLLDERERGRTPLDVADLAPGVHTVRVTLPGYAPAQLSLEVVAGTPLAPLRFGLQPLTATLRVRSEPSDAEVRIGDKLVGRTPLEGFVVEPGLHEVRVERPGYRPWQQALSTGVGDTPVIDARLEPLRGRPAHTAVASAALREGDLVEPGPAVTQPKRVQGESASYPPAAQRARFEGSVTIEMIVTEAGEPRDLRVVESAGELLDQAVLDAAKTWRFEPARKAGLRVKYRLRVRQTFKLNG